jgi:predicted enzyme related to lactoylglutathione lyase
VRAQRFYGGVLGWNLQRVHPASNYFDAVERVGIFDEAAAFGREITPSATLYFGAGGPLGPALDLVRRLGGRAGETDQMGPYYTAMCHDDQGTEFGLLSETLE